MTRTDRARFWAKHLSHQRRGLLSRREYRAKHGLNLPAETDAALDALMPWNYAGATAEAGTAK